MGCHYCDKADGLRPYGPGGAMVCFPCATATPERERDAQRAYKALLDAADAVSPSGIVAVGEQDGPRPFDPREMGH